MTGTSAVDTTIIRQAFIAAPLPKWPETGWTALYSAPPTARTLAPTGFRIHVWCKACRHSVDADPDALIRNGKGDIPLVQLKWQCGNCRSLLTDFVMTGSHFGPCRADRGKTGS